jgi:pilus assembly protein Flp/PilA
VKNLDLLGEGEFMPVRIVEISSILMAMLSEEGGQDLIEYALVVALIAFAAISGMGTVANAINTAFTNIGTTLTNAI